jgi:hypothetical protein
MPQQIPPLSTYDGGGYDDTDRVAALALRAPLLALLYGMPAPARGPWLAALAAGFLQGATEDLLEGVEVDRQSDAYAAGRRISLLLLEEGHA